jgi:hypothetical protein
MFDEEHLQEVNTAIHCFKIVLHLSSVALLYEVVKWKRDNKLPMHWPLLSARVLENLES